MRRLLILAALAGCAPQAAVGRARTLPPGASTIGGGIDASVTRPNSPNDTDPKLPSGNLGVTYRRGLTDRVEMGGRTWGIGIPAFWTLGIALDGKVSLRRSPDPRHGIDVAADVIVGYERVVNGGTPWHIGSAAATILVGHNLGRHAITWGPRAGYAIWGGEGQNPIYLQLYGASCAFAWRLGKNWELTPELLVLYSPVHFGGEVEGSRQDGAWATQLSIGLTRRL